MGHNKVLIGKRIGCHGMGHDRDTDGTYQDRALQGYLWADNRMSQRWDMTGILMGHNGMACNSDMDGVLQGWYTTGVLIRKVL